MRLLLLAHGPSIHTRRWARAFLDEGHEVLLLSTEPTPEPGVATRLVGGPSPVAALRFWGARGAVREALAAFRPDVTVAHFLPDYGFLAARANARPLLLSCWGSDLLINATRTPLHRARARYVLRRSDLIHVDARVLAEAAVRLGAPESRVWTRPWGVDVKGLAPRGPWSERRVPGRPIRILWTRQLKPIYDPRSFILALGRLKRRGVPFRATLAGEGPMRAELEGLARREEVTEEARFEGFVDDARLRALYRDADLYVSLSLSDSTSQSLLEAMAAGLALIVTDIEGNREWVAHRREGYLVPVGDPEAVACAIAEMSRDPEADAMVDRAHAAVAERGDFRRTLEEMGARLRALAASRGVGV